MWDGGDMIRYWFWYLYTIAELLCEVASQANQKKCRIAEDPDELGYHLEEVDNEPKH